MDLNAARFEALIRLPEDAIVCVDLDGIVRQWSEGAQRLLGYTAAEIVGQSVTKLAPSDKEDEIMHGLSRAIRGERVPRHDSIRRTKDGELVEVSVAVTAVRDAEGRVHGLCGVLHDIGRVRRVERHIVFLEQAFSVLEGVIQAALTTRDEPSLYREACRLAVERGGLRMAWIGKLDARTGNVTPVAWHGAEAGYVAQLNISVSGEPRGQGPTARAIRERRPVASPDIEHDPRMSPWREAALARGYRSAAAFPLNRKGTIVGTMNVYAGERDFFSATSLHWLTAVADVLSFALDRTEA